MTYVSHDSFVNPRAWAVILELLRLLLDLIRDWLGVNADLPQGIATDASDIPEGFQVRSEPYSFEKGSSEPAQTYLPCTRARGFY